MAFKLETAIVRIVAPNGGTVGTGFVLTDDGLIATCAHVIADVGIGPGETVNFVFPCTGEEGQAVVEVDWWREPEAEDVAILRLIGELPEPVKPLPLGASAGAANHSFETIGFPPTNSTGGILGGGVILGQTRISEVLVLQLRSQEVTSGFSGAPVWDCTTRRVVGMVTATADPDGRWRLAETAFITPTETLRLVCTDLQLTDICPYRSLEPFTETDADFFFGRSRLVEKLLVRLKSSPRFLAVLGPSGSGKSSLVRAGIIPAIRQGHVPGSDRWKDIIITPSDNPFRQLETKGLVITGQDLTRGVHQWQIKHSEYERLMLVIDQFEELFTLCPDSILRAFVNQLTALLDGVWPVTVILTLRSDFYGYLTEKATSLLPWLEQGIVNIPLTLSRSELVEIVQARLN
ncbi:MAG: trypsin-like peptidase domain-containing protein [Anaerolineales bacterium]|nr:trypsin-like peptidase domain-containing protein [Anaerolineales bacterium]